jgi:hypothetical protein
MSAITVATHPEAKQGAQRLYEQLAITAEDIAEIIAFAVMRPRRATRSWSGPPRRSADRNQPVAGRPVSGTPFPSGRSRMPLSGSSVETRGWLVPILRAVADPICLTRQGGCGDRAGATAMPS